MTGITATQWIGHSAAAMVAVGLSGLLFSARAEQAVPRRLVARYEAYLRRELTFLRSDLSPRACIAAQAIWLVSVLFLVCWTRSPLGLLLLLFLVLPQVVLTRARRDRVARIEEQLDTWLLALANALKATPSFGEALRASAELMRRPISEEIDLVIKENNLGTTLDQALRNLATRVGGRTTLSAITTVIVGTRSGSDVPRTLEESAASLREIARLEALVRTKTAEGRAQAYVLGSVPFFMSGVLYWLNPTLLRPLWETGTGHIVVATAVLLWLGAIASGVKILSVEV